jgi:hypothetical protein
MNWNAVEAVAAILAILTALAALIVSLEAYRNSYQPILRPVPARSGGCLRLDAVILKNIGRGAAMSIVAVQDRGRDETTLVGEIDALEPLGELHGPNFTEESRVGRRGVALSPASLVRGKAYRVI